MAYGINGNMFPTKINEILEKEAYRTPFESYLRRVYAVENFLYLDARRKNKSTKNIYEDFLGPNSPMEIGTAGNILGEEIEELAGNFQDRRWPEKLQRLDKETLKEVGGTFRDFLRSKEFEKWCFSNLSPKPVARKIGVDKPQVVQAIEALIVATAAERGNAETLAAAVIKHGNLKLTPKQFIVALKKKDGWLRLGTDALPYAENKGGKYVFKKGQARLGNFKDFSSDKSKKAFEHLVNLYLKNQESAASNLYKKLQKDEPALKPLSFKKMIEALENAGAFT